jgi:cell division protein FtsW
MTDAAIPLNGEDARAPRKARSRGDRTAAQRAPSRASVFFGWWASIDRPILITCILLMTAGVLLAFAATGTAAARTDMPNEYHYVIRQIVFAGLAAGVLLAMSFLAPDNVRRIAVLAYAGAIVLMLVVVFAGHEAKGASRWIKVAGFTAQPSEIMKPALIVLAAALFARRAHDPGFPAARLAFGLFCVPVVLLLLQPDVGQTGLLTLSFLTLFVVAGMPWLWIAALASIAIVGIGALYFVLPHFAARIQTHLSNDPEQKFQVNTALDAIASGRLFGQGLGEGVVKRHLPDGHTDFIYSLAAEEFGLISSLGLIALFAFLVVRGLWVARRQRDPFCHLAATGLFALVGFQAAINLAVNLDLFPTKGMTLPFISYGGSSLLGTALTLGLALALTRRRPGSSLPA